MQETTKKVYAKPEIAEMARLDRFVNDMFNAESNDGVKYYTKFGYLILEKNLS